MRSSQIFKYGILCVLGLFSTFTFSQGKTISGSIKSNKNESLVSASVTLIDNDSTIIAYAISNKNGEFHLKIPTIHQSLKSLWLEVSFLGYRKQRKPIEIDAKQYNFVLVPDETSLDEVVVKNRPKLKRKGDTLRYHVANFSKAEDRTIGDVLRRMPGIDIANDGTIYYNGEEIENLYVHGDDLMSGKYNLASKTIRKEDIVDIDVMRNHQPIKVLKDKIFSDKTSINLILKDENSFKLSTKAILGGGLPEQYDVSVTPILLNKNIKMLNTFALNNNGVDYRNDFKQLGGSNFSSDIGTTKPEFSLSLGTIGPPDLPLSNYYFNNSVLIDLNNLYNNEKEWQFKLNIQGFIDKSSLEYNSRIENYTASDTIVYREQQNLLNRPKLLYTSFNVMSNKDHYFFNNNLQVNLKEDDDNAFMNFNNYTFSQSLDKNEYKVSNDLNWMPQLSLRGIGEVRWLINYNSHEQQLNIGKGYNFETSDQEGYHDSVMQSMRLPTLFSNAFLSYKISNDLIKQQYKMGYINEYQKLESVLSFIDNGQLSPYSGDVGNNLEWNRQNIYFSVDYQLEYKKLQTTISLPFSYQYIHYSQDDYSLNSKNNNFIFNPDVTIKYNINVEQRITARYSYSHIFGNIMDIYRGVVLQNYRMLRANNADLQKKEKSSYNLNYSFEKSINLLFANMGLTYNRVTANSILSSNINDNIQATYLLPYKNVQKNIILNLGFSKYIFALNSTFSIKSQLSTSKFEHIINSSFLKNKKEEHKISP